MPNEIAGESTDYLHGYSEAHRAFLSVRTANREAAFFLPHLKPGMRLLDCGSGMGALTTSLAEHLAPGEVVGIDRDPSQVEAARAWAAEKGARNVRFETGDIQHIPYPDASFDAAFAFTVLEHVKDPLSILREMRRILKPEGVIGILDPDYGGMIMAPELPQAIELRDYMLRYSEENASPYYARHLRRCLLDAGFARTEAFALCVGGGNERMANFNYELVIKPTIENLRPWIIQRGLADNEHIDECLAAYKAWCERPDSFFALTQIAAVGWAS